MLHPVDDLHPSKPELSVKMDAISVNHSLLIGLRHEAAKRDVPITRLVHDLLCVIIDDHLVTAVLDD
jgi:hypothetical protein